MIAAEFAEDLRASGCTVRETARGWSVQCPAHEDRSPSLSIAEGRGGRVLVHCHAGCTVDQVVTAAGRTLADLAPRDSLPPPRPRTRRPKPRYGPQTHAEWVASIEAAAARQRPRSRPVQRPEPAAAVLAALNAAGIAWCVVPGHGAPRPGGGHTWTDNVNMWHAQGCPACGTVGLVIADLDRLRLSCASGCPTDEILASLEDRVRRTEVTG